MTSTSCKCGNPRRPGQRNCHRCHAAEQRGYRKRLLHFAKIGRAVEEKRKTA